MTHKNSCNSELNLSGRLAFPSDCDQPSSNLSAAYWAPPTHTPLATGVNANADMAIRGEKHSQSTSAVALDRRIRRDLTLRFTQMDKLFDIANPRYSDLSKGVRLMSKAVLDEFRLGLITDEDFGLIQSEINEAKTFGNGGEGIMMGLEILGDVLNELESSLTRQPSGLR